MELFGLILSHTISTFIIIFFCAAYLLLNIKKLKNKEVLKCLLINLLFIILVTSIFWVPLLEHKLNAEYEVFREDMMGSPESMQNNAIPLELFLKTEDNFVVFEIGLPIFLMIIATPFVLKKLSKEYYKKTYYIFWIFGVISLFLCTKYFPWDRMPQIFGMIQFPWRFLEFAVFFLSFTAGITFELLFNGKVKIVFIYILLILSLFPYTKYISYDDNFNEETYYTPSRVTASQRINAGLAKFEYLPTKANSNKEYIENRTNDVYILEGDAILSNVNKYKSKMSFEINKATENTQLELPYIYYLGYTVKINGEKVNTQESINGFLEINLNEDIENANVTVEYTGTPLMYISATVSIISFLSLAIYIILREN